MKFKEKKTYCSLKKKDVANIFQNKSGFLITKLVELCGAILSIFNVLEQVPIAFSLFRRMPQRCFSVKLQKCFARYENFTRPSIGTGGWVSKFSFRCIHTLQNKLDSK